MKNILIGFFAFSATLANAQTVVLDANFETGTDGFTVVNQDNLTPNSQVSEFSDAWIRLADPDNTSDTVMGSTSFFEPIGTADRWLISPQINLGTFGNFLSWEAKSHDASFPDDYYVLVSKTDNAIASFTDTVGYIQEEDDQWQTREVNLTGFNLDGESIYVAFVNRTNNGFKLYVDDVAIRIDDPVSLEEKELDFSIYPNPAKDFISIQTQDLKSVKIFNSQGQEIMESVSNKIDVRFLSTGVYFIQVETSEGIGQKKFVKL